ncbi:MAG: hypothetical protein F6J95_020690 [Leptolyngbya sp. SIO1E4]|nr:hypothetical protein [Leptolyngbya sp. SIO1E4]
MTTYTEYRYLAEGDYVSTAENVKKDTGHNRSVGKLYFPYLIQRTRGDRWVVLNRDYKPLGIVTREHVDYDQYAILLKMTAKIANALTYKATGVELTGVEDESIYFYDDGCNPFGPDSQKHWPTYQEKLKILSKLETVITR